MYCQFSAIDEIRKLIIEYSKIVAQRSRWRFKCNNRKNKKDNIVKVLGT